MGNGFGSPTSPGNVTTGGTPNGDPGRDDDEGQNTGGLTGGSAGMTASGSGGWAGGFDSATDAGSRTPPTAGSADGGMAPVVETPCTGSRIPTQLALYVAIDESLSMTVPVDSWTPLSGALSDWTSTLASTQLEVLMFAGSCAPDAYAQPTLALAEASAQQAALDARMNTSVHGFGASTVSALTGVVARARGFAESGSGNAAVVLITSSEPATCGNANPELPAMAGMSSATPVPTYVLALQPRSTLDRVASAGGTQAARSVDDAGSQSEIRAALQAIGDEARCHYALSDQVRQSAPDGIALEIDVDGQRTLATRVASAEECAAVAHGFYYDDAAAPRFAIACPQTCALGGTVVIATGCTGAP